MDSFALFHSSQAVVPPSFSTPPPPPPASSLPPLPDSPTDQKVPTNDAFSEGGITSPSIAEMMSPEDPSLVLYEICQMEVPLSEIRTKVYELQELRHSNIPASTSSLPTPPPSGLPPSSSSTSTSTVPPPPPPPSPPQIDDLLILLNTHLEGMSSLVPGIQQRVARLEGNLSDEAQEVRERWEEVEEEWEEVVKEVEGVKEELKEDRWLVVFRTAASQAEDMMESLEKVVSQCYDLIHQVRRLQNPSNPTSSSSPGPSRIISTSPPSSWGIATGEPSRSSLTLSSFETVLKSFEAKKKYYYPSVERVLSILDKGVRERVTRNGEVLLRHSTMLARWRSLSEKLNRLGVELTSAHLWLLTRESPHMQPRLPRPLVPSSSSVDLSRTAAPLASPPPSETGSSAGGSKYTLFQGNQKLQTSSPSDTPTKSRRSSVASTFSRSMSPLQGMFGKMTMRGSGAGGGAGAARTVKESPASNGRPPSTTGYFSKFKPRNSTASPAPSTPRSDFFGASSSTSTEDQIPPSVMRVAKPRWNASPKVPDLPLPVFESSTPSGPRSGLPRRTSMANLRSVSGGPGGTLSPTRAVSPTLSDFGSGSATYRPPARPTTPSRIPRRQPSRARLSMDGEEDDIPTSMMQRAHTPTPLGNSPSSPRSHSKSNSLSIHSIPSLSVYPASEASLSPSVNGSPSQFRRVPSPNPNPSSPPRTPTHFDALHSLDRSQTPDLQVRERAIRSSFYTPAKPSTSSITPPSRGRVSQTARGSSPASTNPSPSGSNNPRSPPSSYRGDVNSPQPTPRSRPSNGHTSSSNPPTVSATPSRPSSRAGEGPSRYRPDKRNPLDVEIARIVNGALNGIHVERIDPIPKGQLQALSPEANTAQYAFFGGGGGGTKRVMSCRLLELNRGSKSGETMKVRKVMVRVGGGWLDLEVHVFKLGL